MRPSFHPRLINPPFSDPGLFIPFLFEKRALLFDLGDLHLLSAKDLLKVTHVFVTHAHMDHFIGFDTLLRIYLGRERELHLFGPPGFLRRVEGRLDGYTWNLIDESPHDFRLKVTEVRGGSILTRTYVGRKHFASARKDRKDPFSGLLLKEPAFHVEADLLDHRIPCLGLTLLENFHVSIIKEGLKELDLIVGPWLTRFKKALYEEWDPEDVFPVTWEQGGAVVKEKRFRLGDLVEKIARITPGQKITYLTDILGSPENCEKASRLAENADQLFIEAAFLDRDRETARRNFHLTAKEAGELARRAGVRQCIPFHFSPRYTHCADEIYEEAEKAYRGSS
jgi:ribonuclease Z